MDERQLNRTWPSPLPTTEQVREVFFDTLGSAGTWRPETHLSHIREILYSGEVYEHLTRTLHKLLSVQGEHNNDRLSGQRVIVGSVAMAPLDKHMGIHRTDLRKKVLPVLRNSLADVVNSDEKPEDKLDTLALTMGTVTAEAQVFSDGNTRIARTIHDYIKGGDEALSIERIADVRRNFTIPSEIEMLIAMQNITQLIEHPDEAILNSDGVMMVSDRAQQAYNRAEARMNNIWRLDDMQWQSMGGEDRAKARRELVNRVKSILSHTVDWSIFDRSYGTLLQQYYGPAALAASFPDRQPSFPLSLQAMERLVNTNDDLMKMRALSIGVGMARKGMFASIERDDSTNQPTIKHIHWHPNTQ